MNICGLFIKRHVRVHRLYDYYQIFVSVTQLSVVVQRTVSQRLDEVRVTRMTSTI